MEEDQRRAATAEALSRNVVYTERNRTFPDVAEELLRRGIWARREMAVVSAMLSDLFRVSREAPALDALNPIAQLRAAEQRAEPLARVRKDVEDFMVSGNYPTNEDREAARTKAAALRTALVGLLDDATTKIEV
jgi:hypothetical protein